MTNDWITKELKNYRVLRVDGTEVNRSSSEELRTCTVETLAGLKGTHARDFHSLFLNFFLHLSVTGRYKT